MKRIVFGVLVLAVAVFVPIYYRLNLYRPNSHSNTWMLESCTIVKDSRAPLVDAGALLTLRGPSVITATTDNVCVLSLDTRFFRDGAYVCVEGHGADAQQNPYCYKIESEVREK